MADDDFEVPLGREADGRLEIVWVGRGHPATLVKPFAGPDHIMVRWAGVPEVTGISSHGWSRHEPSLDHYGLLRPESEQEWQQALARADQTWGLRWEPPR